MAISLSGLYVATFGLETRKPEGLRPFLPTVRSPPLLPPARKLRDEFMAVVTFNDN